MSARWRPFLVLAALQLLAVLVYGGVEAQRGAARPFRHEALGDGPRLPEVELERADGSRFSVGALKGRRVLLHFWATSCPPCREELPLLLARARGVEGLEVVLVTTDEAWGAVRQFFGGEIPPEVVRDPSGVLVRAFDVSALPDSYLLDGAGLAVERVSGARDWRSEEAGALLR